MMAVVLLPQLAVSLLPPILVDGSNLALRLGQEPANPSLFAAEAGDFSRVLGLLRDEPRTARASGADCVVFDGIAFNRAHAGREWTDESGLQVAFTADTQSADDLLLSRVREEGAGRPCVGGEILTARQVVALLEGEDDAPLAFSGTLTRSVAIGRSNRAKQQQFLRSVGMQRVGATSHFLSFTEAQRARSLALVRGLQRFGDSVQFTPVAEPAALLVTDDQGLRRRCMALDAPPAILGRQQLYNWLGNLAVEREDEELRAVAADPPAEAGDGA